jgi:hypothetical protein
LAFTAKIVLELRRGNGLPSHFERLRARGLLTIPEVAERLGVSKSTIKAWHRAGLLVSQANDKNVPLFDPPRPGDPTASMALSRERPEILAPPTDAPPRCRQATITVPPDVNAKTRQKHDYPSKAHRLSYGRRSAAERSNSTVKDPASNDISRGWCRLMGLGPMTVMLTCLFVVRNQRVLASFEARQAEDQRRAATGQPPKTRKRRRRTIADLVTAS